MFYKQKYKIILKNKKQLKLNKNYSFSLKADGGGVIKIWNIAKGTCVKTLDKHEGKIWSLDVSRYD